VPTTGPCPPLPAQLATSLARLIHGPVSAVAQRTRHPPNGSVAIFRISAVARRFEAPRV
jgi:hypothetical protein